MTSIDAMLDGDASSMLEAVRGRSISAAELVDAHLLRIAQRDPAIGAVWHHCRDRARREAAMVDAALARGENPGPLAGLPVGWKDLIDTAGDVTSYGSAIWRQHVPARDADVVARFVAAGAVTLAKLALDELAWSATGENAHFGVCRNPYDHTRMTGGSSAGSAAALACGMVALAPGTDTGGSIRCPASCCGVVGLKPTYGRVSLAGIHPLCPGFDHCGPMGRSVRDCALQLEVMAGPSPRDPRTPAVPVPRYRDVLGHDLGGLVVGVPQRFFFESAAPEIALRVRACIDLLDRAGARILELDLEWPPVDIEPYALFEAEQAASLGEHWPARRADLGERIAREVEAAHSRGAVDDAVVRGRRMEYQARTLAAVVAAHVDLIVHPTEALTPPLLGTSAVLLGHDRSVEVSSAMCALTEIYDVLGWPAISVPCGNDGDGMPIGCQIASLPWREADCLAAAFVIETAYPATRPVWADRRDD